MHFSVLFPIIWYNCYINNVNALQTGSPETVTIAMAEYEKLQAQSKHVSELESHVEMLMETLLPEKAPLECRSSAPK